MLVAVIGGRLQGVEVVYLAHKAGFETLVFDKDPNAPASRMSDQFQAFEFKEDQPFPEDCPPIDIIIPAIEDDRVLSLVEKWAAIQDIPLVFDSNAYGISSSKLASNMVFEKLQLPIPKSWPGCTFPVIIKPDQASGSTGITIMDNPDDFYEWYAEPQPGNLVIQEFVQGPSYSIEVVGCPGRYHALPVTDLGMDKEWDCNRVSAPSRLSSDQIGRFKQMVVRIAGEIRLTGIMDLEAILHENQLKILEIDARFPSQTPMAVYGSSGINMVEMLVYQFLDMPVIRKKNPERPALVEHIKVDNGKIEYPGEHVMGLEGPLTLQSDFFGANEAVTSFENHKTRWVATLIFTADSFDDMDRKRTACYSRIKEQIQNDQGATR